MHSLSRIEAIGVFCKKTEVSIKLNVHFGKDLLLSKITRGWEEVQVLD